MHQALGAWPTITLVARVLYMWLGMASAAGAEQTPNGSSVRSACPSSCPPLSFLSLRRAPQACHRRGRSRFGRASRAMDKCFTREPRFTIRRVRAWVVRRNGPPESMTFEDLPNAPPPPGRLRIAVEAAGINFFDSLLIAGTYQQKPELPFVPGAEVAGTVVDAPPGSGFAPGDRVLARLQSDGISGGGYADTAHPRPQDALKIPDSMSFDVAAAFFINYETGWFGLHRRANIQPGEFLLVHAAAGGVGSAAVQLGKAAGATVIASVGSPEKAEVCRKLGADLVIEHREQDLVQAVKDFTHGHGADVVYDPVGGDAFERSTKCIAFEGRLIVVGFTSGQIPQVRTNHVLIKNYSVVGLHWGLYAERRPDLIDQCADELLRLYAAGRIAPYVSRKVPLERAAEALGDVAAGRTTGKTVLMTRWNSASAS